MTLKAAGGVIGDGSQVESSLTGTSITEAELGRWLSIRVV